MDLVAILTRALEADRARIGASAVALGHAGRVELTLQMDVNTRMRQVAIRVPGLGVRFHRIEPEARGEA